MSMILPTTIPSKSPTILELLVIDSTSKPIEVKISASSSELKSKFICSLIQE